MGLNGDPAVFAILAGFVAAIVAALVAGRTYSKITFHPHSATFRGHLLVSFHEDSLPGPEFLPNLRRVQRSRASQLSRRGLSGGKMRFRPEGISWHAGSIGTPKQLIEGDFLLPWDSIEQFDVGDIPMKLRLLGGAIAIKLKGVHGQLDGEFLGSHRLLLEALANTPLAAPTQD
jgi:hypothetical protein